MEKIPPGTRLQIATAESIAEKTGLILSSVFVLMMPDNNILFSAPIHDNAVYPLLPGEIIYVRYQTDEGLFNFSCSVITQPVRDPSTLIKARLTSDINRKQYREFYRMKKAVEGQIAMERNDGIVISDFLTHDISASGLYIYSNEYFTLGDVVGVSLPAGSDGEKISLYSEVVWIRESPRYGYVNCAGLNFIYENEHEREKMAKFVFDLQLASLQRQRQMLQNRR